MTKINLSALKGTSIQDFEVSTQSSALLENPLHWSKENAIMENSTLIPEALQDQEVAQVSLIPESLQTQEMPQVSTEVEAVQAQETTIFSLIPEATQTEEVQQVSTEVEAVETQSTSLFSLIPAEVTEELPAAKESIEEVVNAEISVVPLIAEAPAEAVTEGESSPTPHKKMRLSLAKKSEEKTQEVEASLWIQESVTLDVSKAVSMDHLPEFHPSNTANKNKDGKIEEFFPNLLIGIESEDHAKYVKKVAEDISKNRQGGLASFMTRRVLVSLGVVLTTLTSVGIGSYFFLPTILHTTKTSVIEGAREIKQQAEIISSGALNGTGSGLLQQAAQIYREGIDYTVIRGNKQNTSAKTQEPQ